MSASRQVQVLGVGKAEVSLRPHPGLGRPDEERGEGVLRPVLDDHAGGQRRLVTLVHPVPDRPAAGAGSRLEELPVLVEPAVAVAHRVRVLALDERSGIAVPRLAGHVRGGLVHVADDVDVRLVVRLLVVDGARLVVLADPLRGRHEVHPVPGLVAERPDDDRRVVLERLDVPPRAVEVGQLPLRLVREGLVGVVAHPVRLDVGLGDQVDPELVGELVPLGNVRVVGGADEVEVVLFEDLDVLQHGVAPDVLSGARVPLVPVDAPDEDGLAVDEDLPVPRLDLAEADTPGHDPEAPARAVLQGEKERVEVRLLVGPLPRVRDQGLQGDGGGLAGGGPTGLREGGEDGLARRVEERGLDREALLGGGGVADRHGQPEGGVLVLRVQVGDHAEVLDMQGLGGPEDHVAEDPAQAPEVLALQVGPVGEAVDLDREEVLARLHGVGDVELRGPAAVLAVADLLPVDPEVEAGGDALERDPHAPPLPRGRHLEAVAVRADVVQVVRARTAARSLPGRRRGWRGTRRRGRAAAGRAAACSSPTRSRC